MSSCFTFPANVYGWYYSHFYIRDWGSEWWNNSQTPTKQLSQNLNPDPSHTPTPKPSFLRLYYCWTLPSSSSRYNYGVSVVLLMILWTTVNWEKCDQLTAKFLCRKRKLRLSQWACIYWEFYNSYFKLKNTHTKQDLEEEFSHVTIESNLWHSGPYHLDWKSEMLFIVPVLSIWSTYICKESLYLLKNSTVMSARPWETTVRN